MGLFFVVWFCFRDSRLGDIIRAVGENPEDAHSSGISVTRTRYAGELFGGLIPELTGIYQSLAYSPFCFSSHRRPLEKS